MWGAGGLVHPRTSIGGEARWLAVHEVDEPDSGRGRSEAKRNGVPPASHILSLISTKKEGNSLLSHLLDV